MFFLDNSLRFENKFVSLPANIGNKMNRMKRLAFVLVIVSNFVLCAKAQNPVGQFSLKPMAGVNISTFANAAIDMYHTKAGFTGGVELEYGVNSWLGVSAGLLYSQQGVKIEGSALAITQDAEFIYYIATEMDGKLKCDYLNLPVMANFYIPAIKGLAVKAGVQIGFLASDKISVDTKNVIMPVSLEDMENNKGYNLEVYNLNDYPRTSMTSQSVSQSGVCKSVDFCIPLGLSYEYKNITLDARYYFGLTQIDKTENPDTAQNRYLSITLGYRFGL